MISVGVIVAGMPPPDVHCCIWDGIKIAFNIIQKISQLRSTLRYVLTGYLYFGNDATVIVES